MWYIFDKFCSWITENELSIIRPEQIMVFHLTITKKQRQLTDLTEREVDKKGFVRWT